MEMEGGGSWSCSLFFRSFFLSFFLITKKNKCFFLPPCAIRMNWNNNITLILEGKKTALAIASRLPEGCRRAPSARRRPRPSPPRPAEKSR